MGEPFGGEAIERLSAALSEPAWVTELRRRAWARHAELPWPHPSDEVWRRTNVSWLDPAQGFTPAAGADASDDIPADVVERLASALGEEHRLIRADGRWRVHEPPEGVWAEELGKAFTRQPDAIRQAMEADGLTEPEQKLTSLNAAFHHDDVVLRVPAGWDDARPLRLVRLITTKPRHAVFPLTVILVGEGSRVTVIDESVGVPSGSGGPAEPDLVHGRVELVVEPNASVQYVRLQRWGSATREFFLARARLARGSTLTSVNVQLGAALSKSHVIVSLDGQQASSRLYGFVFGHDRQHVDQHTVQDHRAARTHSNLEFRAALQDEGRMIYTGLIRIAKAAAQTEAFQANHNLMLSRGAKAETIPMLEILADDVQCKHGASTGPIDEEQRFYLMSRGVEREAAQRLIVMGFVESIMQQIPYAPLQEKLRREIESGLQHG